MLRLTKERLKLGLTKAQLGFETKIQPSDIGKLEAKKIFPYNGFKTKLEKYFGIPADELFEEI